MADVTVIGRSAFVKGRVSGAGDLHIAGRVEGEVTSTGAVTVDETGLVAANLTARRLVVRGAVRGDLTADEAILVERGAKVVGDVRAPRIAVAAGALVRGYVETAVEGVGRANRAAATATRDKPKPAATPAVTARAQAPAREASPPTKQSSPAPSTASAKADAKAAPRGATLAGKRKVPPAPMVPALKKGGKAVQKRR
ncbi:MAG: polymer-forming cytoskeletal protein [Myxococcales bacterium]|nr:polymer-forming cytoskeletal protein [Myxococcales bacterium]